MNTDMKQETKFEIVPLNLTVTGKATGNVANFHKSIFDYLEHLSVVELKKDADFEKAKELIKQLKNQEDLIDEAEEQAKNGSVTVADAFRMLDEAKSAVRKARLALNTQVKADTDKRKANMLSEAVSKITNFRNELINGLQISGLTRNFDAYYTDQIRSVMHGKTICDKTQKSVDTAVDALKLAAEQQLNLIASNKALIESQENRHLFNDISSLVVMPFMELKTVIDQRNAGEKERLKLLQEQEAEKARLKAEKDLAEKEAEKERLRKIEAEKEAARIAEETKQFEEAEAKRLESEKQVSAEIAPIENHFRGVTKLVDPVVKENLTTQQPEKSTQPQEEAIEQVDEEPDWMNPQTAKEDFPIGGIQEFQISFQATQTDADGIKSYIQKIYMGSNPILTLANQQG